MAHKEVSIEEATKIMGKENIITPKDLILLKDLAFDFNKNILPIPFTLCELRKKSKDYLLIYGCSKLKNGLSTNILNLKKIFGDKPNAKTPCFYFQDWYNNEEFVNTEMKEGWYFIRKHVYDNSRRILPEELAKQYVFPSAIQCTYSFFVAWLVLNKRLWYHDYVWCCDLDHNGDRIYVGKYNDVDGINNDGFSIHRHLSLRSCYGCID